jgi:hypothetical protein
VAFIPRINLGQDDPWLSLLLDAQGLLVYDGKKTDPISMQEAEELATLSRTYARQGHADARMLLSTIVATKAGLLILDKSSSPSSR